MSFVNREFKSEQEYFDFIKSSYECAHGTTVEKGSPDEQWLRVICSYFWDFVGVELDSGDV